MFECLKDRVTFLFSKSITFIAPESSAAAKKLSVSFTERQLISSSFTWKHSTGSLRDRTSSKLIVSPWEVYSLVGQQGENTTEVTSSASGSWSCPAGVPPPSQSVSSPLSAPEATRPSEFTFKHNIEDECPPVHLTAMFQGHLWSCGS